LRPTPIRGDVGPAAHTSSGHLRLPLSSTVATAVLFGAVVVFGLGPSSPLALGLDRIDAAPVVRVPHDVTASGPEQRGPQPSPGPERLRMPAKTRQAWTSVTQRPTATRPVAEQPAGLPTPGSTPPTRPPATPSVQPPPPPTEVAATALPEPPAPPLEVTVPMLTVPPLPPLPPLPAPLPELPSAPLDLPG
jgi:hypothetical protein